MIKPEQLKEVNNRIDAIEEYLKIKEKKMQLAEEELKTQDPGFWDDPKKAEIQMKAIRSLKYWVATFDTLKSSYEDLEVEFNNKKYNSTNSTIDVKTSCFNFTYTLVLLNKIFGDESLFLIFALEIDDKSTVQVFNR